MTNEEIKKREIESALAAMNGGDFLQTSNNLLEVLDYHAPLTEELLETVDNFIQKHPAENKDTKTEREFRKNAKSIELVSQVGSDEIADSQPDRFESRTFDGGLIQSFVFCTVELKDKDYSRSKYAQFTREINKRLPLATVVFFRVENRLTIGFVGRRQHKRDPDLDVLEQVTLIKDIRLDDPHRAHLDILFELSLGECAKWMADHNKQENFDGLLEAWLARLDTEELNKQFYRKLFSWFEWAVKEAKFPTDKKRTLDPEEHVIRLITRLLFVWFIKEKGLVADELFNETQVSCLLKDYDRNTGDSYYRTVLQNLFFATLNTEIEKRGFSKEGPPDHRNFSRYRYKDQMLDPDTLLALFAQTPFINGGLFDCLDSFRATRGGGYRIDCFSDKHYNKLSMPNRLFFDDDLGLISLLKHYKFTIEENTPIEQDVALDPELLGKVFENLLAAYNPETGETARRQTGSYYTPRPIVDYMVEEALVATLAGQVSPTESNASLWKDQLRYLLDYAQVCDDASEWFDDDETDRIMRAISELKILDPAVGSGAFPMGMLHKLTLALRRLDPKNNRWEQLQRDRAAKRAQAAFKISNQQTREVELVEISDTFERYRDSDFGRKLYLIQNSIFGVDIQPIACQIAKLRFFISLAIEQEPTTEADNNFGIKPLPNLETRFVAADTLIDLQLSETRSLLQDDAVQQLLKKIEEIHEKYFLANNRQQKLDLEDQEDKCRERLKEELEIQRTKWVKNRKREIEQKIAQLPTPKHREQLREVERKKYEGRKKEFDSGFEDVRKIADWKPYDQNAKADWFDPEWMFGITDGFDVVIGNPPYIQLQKEGGKLARLYAPYSFDSFIRTGDIYCLFYEKANQLSKKDGHVCFITSNKWMHTAYGKKLRDYFIEHTQPIQLLDMGSSVFDATVYTNILLLQNSAPNVCLTFAAITIRSDFDKHTGNIFQYLRGDGVAMELPAKGEPWAILSPTELALKNKIKDVGKPLKDWDINIYRGIITGCNEAFVINEIEREELIVQDSRSAEIIKPLLRGRDIKRYHVQWAGLYMLATGYDLDIPNNYPAIYNHLQTIGEQIESGRIRVRGRGVFNRDDQGENWWNLRACTYYSEFEEEKVVYPNMTKFFPFVYDPNGFYTNDKSFIITGGNYLKYLTGYFNSRVAAKWIRENCPELQGGARELRKVFFENIPIPHVTKANQHLVTQIETRVDKILAAKRTNPDADVSDLENEIDQIVYLLYDLTPEEIDIVEEAENV